jgi:peptidoglycan/LPS O-acetylase OafA/YrhL
LPGGFIGVDVFFAISGFLIGSQLLREIVDTGRIRLAQFWARRAKRLLPASCLVLALTALGVFAWVPIHLWRQFFTEIGAATLYVQNWQLARDSVDYSASGNDPSPVQHFWTLSVEEQFYIAIPLLFLVAVGLAWALGRRSPQDRRRVVAMVLAVAAAVSLGLSVYLTYWSASSAYFSTLTRAWEFALGALVAFLPPMASRRVRAAGGALGIGLVIAGGILFSSSTPFPSFTAGLPVVGAMLALWLGRGTWLEAAGRFTPIALGGECSYAIYLWHWPLICLLPYAIGHPLGRNERLVVAAASLAVAWVATTQWENRVRFSPRWLGTRRPRTIAAWTGGGMAVVLAISGFGIVQANAQTTAQVHRVAEIWTNRPACFGADAMADPECHNPGLDGVLLPEPSAIDHDDANREECWSTRGVSDLKVCPVGTTAPPRRTLLAIGDSHNNTLIGAYDAIGKERGWRFEVTGASGCHWSTADLRLNTPEDTEACRVWRGHLVDYLATRPDLDAIIETKARNHTLAQPAPGQDGADAIVEGLAGAANARPYPAIPVIFLVDNPQLSKKATTCAAKHGLDGATRCAVPRSEALTPDGFAEAAAQVPGSHLIDLTDLYCSPTDCPPVIGHVVVYRRDGTHITATYALTIAPYLDAALAEILSDTPVRTEQ